MTIKNTEQTCHTFSLKPNTYKEFTVLNIVLYSITEMGHADIVECLDQESFFITNKFYNHLKNPNKYKKIVYNITNTISSNFDLLNIKAVIPIMTNLLKTIKGCFEICDDKEIIIMISSKDIDKDCCDVCPNCENDCKHIDSKLLN